jgi:hypothetical protein
MDWIGIEADLNACGCGTAPRSLAVAEYLVLRDLRQGSGLFGIIFRDAL